MVHYIIQTIAFQVFFLLIYDVFLKKETFFNWNRFYLLATALLSIILPFIKIESFREVVPQQYIISLPEIILGETQTTINNPILLNAVIIGNNNGISAWEIVFYLGLVMACCLFLYKLIKVIVLIIKNPKTYKGHLIVVKLINSNTAFSFFRYVFLGEFLENEQREAILKHELIHVKQKHTIDLLFFEALRIFFWFNPLVYLYQNRITTLHEFIADAEAVKHENKSNYYQNLLAQVFETKSISFINPFFKQSLIKKRIVMLQKTKSKQIKLLKYALLIPMVLGMLVYTSCEKDEEKVVKQELEISDQIEMLKLAIESKEDKLTATERQNLLNLYLTFKLKNDTNSKGIIESYESQLIKGNSNEVPFAVIEQPPIFPGCEDLEADEQKKCISNKISQHVNKHFNTKLANDLNLKGRQRINVIFKIDTEGNIINVRSRAPHPSLEEEASRVIKTLPKMLSGKQKGEAVVVPYMLPIIFEVAE